MNQQIIQFSHKAITFNRQKPFILQMTNKSQTSTVIFKIKTTKLNTYEVKPPVGSIQPGQKKSIEFKLVKPLTQQQFNDAKSKDKFQFQCLTVSPDNVPKQKIEFKALWDQAKADPTKSANIINFTIPIQSENQANLLTSVNSEPFSPIKVKSNLPKSEIKTTTAKKLFTLQPQQKNDQQLSKQFETLKEKEERLVEERDKIFKSQIKTTSQGSKSGGQIIILAIAFLISIMIGNFLKLRVFVDSEL